MPYLITGRWWLLILGFCLPALANDQPQWGTRWTRNLVSPETSLPESFDVKTGRNVRWVKPLGTETHSTPIVANGRVYIGTNNGQPRDPKHQGDRGVLMCFDERTGNLLWQLVVPKRDEDPYLDWPKSGIASTVTVEDDRVYVVSNRGEVMCLDARGLANGNDGSFQDEARHMTPRNQPPLTLEPGDADILWLYDLPSQAGTWPHDAAHSSILVLGNHLYVNTGTGVDNTHKKIRTPDAPSLVVIDKRSGRLVARERLGIAPNIFHSTWSSPSYAKINGQPTVCFAGGNGIVYGFEPASTKDAGTETQTLKLRWSFDPDPSAPKQDVHRYNTNRREGPSNIYSLPVIEDSHIYFTVGGDLWWGKNEAWLKSISIGGTAGKAVAAEAWSYPLNRHSLSSPVLYKGLIFTADCGRMIHCVEAKTGKSCWTHEVKGEMWASPLVADGKVYLGSRRGDFWIFKASRDKQVLATVNLDSPISATVTAANRTLYVATMFQLYAIRAD
ncbi:MAG: PQQ-binding-like beta-propeller repeat protein [Verrucomicrobiales bacterium]|nr:PQQ-binding-like beta-propeller repeat protein [Verrucomicrobiales bacterium]